MDKLQDMVGNEAERAGSRSPLRQSISRSRPKPSDAAANDHRLSRQGRVCARHAQRANRPMAAPPHRDIELLIEEGAMAHGSRLPRCSGTNKIGGGPASIRLIGK